MDCERLFGALVQSSNSILTWRAIHLMFWAPRASFTLQYCEQKRGGAQYSRLRCVNRTLCFRRRALAPGYWRCRAKLFPLRINDHLLLLFLAVVKYLVFLFCTFFIDVFLTNVFVCVPDSIAHDLNSCCCCCWTGSAGHHDIPNDAEGISGVLGHGWPCPRQQRFYGRTSQHEYRLQPKRCGRLSLEVFQ